MKTILALILLNSLAFAEPTQQSLDAADKLASVLGIKSQMSAGLDAMLPVIEQQAAQFDLSAEEKKELTQIYRTWFEEDFDQQTLSDEITKLYAEAFTAEELMELTAFYESSLGQKTLRALPELMAKGAKLGMEEGQKKQAILSSRLEAFFAEKNQ